MCKKCCVDRQAETITACKEPQHTQVSTSQQQSAESSSAQADVFYDPTRPLTKDHYEVHRRAADEWNKKTNALAERKEQEDLLKKHIAIIFWKVCV